ncbi:DUF5703 domain-containing protein [Sphingobacterium lactis]|uniref:DUF5703 domain-containing protein n=1 Tax=Sphingobacterium lactis TaxID=797291 RepID=UPI003DA26777
MKVQLLKNILLFLALLSFGTEVLGQDQDSQFAEYNVKWTSASQNSSESMPVGGGDIGLNAWVENGDLLVYLGKTGAFDENNTLLKLGRLRIKLSPNLLLSSRFSQELQIEKGQIEINVEQGNIQAKLFIWVDVFSPNIHIEVHSNKAIDVEAAYESWRYEDLYPLKKENNMNSWKWAPPHRVITHSDSIRAERQKVIFYHRNKDITAFDIVVRQQEMESVKDSLFNPLLNLISGGILQGDGFEFLGTAMGKYMDTPFKSWRLKSSKPRKNHHIQTTLHVGANSTSSMWEQTTQRFASSRKANKAIKQENEKWWREFWSRSHIKIFPGNRNAADEAWQVGRNYQLFRFMLACNAYGEYPTKFNGGLFTFDPSSINSEFTFTPDFRNWGGGTHTAQNQRLVYWPMLKAGDFDMMPSQFNFYKRILKNAELRSKVYWGHGGASFTEQIENFGLPNPAEYNWKRPANFDKGLEYNAWLEYQWDTVFEFCMMILELDNFNKENIQEYMPLILSCIQFFDEHYQYRAKQLGNKVLNDKGHLVIYPGSSAETYKMAYNASTTIAALRVVTDRLLKLGDKYLTISEKSNLEEFSKKIPPMPTRIVEGREMLAPAEVWARINNTESPQLYGIYPWGIYGIGRPDLELAINTYWHDPDVLRFRSHIGWKQDNIFAARLGLADEAKRYTTLKLKNAERRFPTFWGPGFDWVPDHNWGGSGMIGLQEMLMQAHEDTIYLFPAWPKEWDVDFKLHAPQQTVITGKLINGQVQDLHVSPQSRLKDVQLLLK